MNDLIQARLSELMKKSYVELSQLTGYQGEKVKHGKVTITLSVWKDVISDRELRIVVQTYRHWALGIGRMEAQGFIVEASGATRELGKAEIYEFV